MASRPIVAEARNPEGRLVQLDRLAWDHVLEEHAELADHLDDVMRTIRGPDFREADPRQGRDRYFRRAGRLGWIRVVTEFAGDVDRIITAFPQSNDPRLPGWLR
jgi:hypothetical protein